MTDRIDMTRTGLSSRSALFVVVASLALVLLGAFSSRAQASAPVIGGESVQATDETTVTVEAKVNPEGESTTVATEVLPSAQFEESGWSGATREREIELPEASETLGVSASITGLTPGASYQIRFLAQNSTTTTYGTGMTVKTLPVGRQGLPDGREYELVSTADPYGEPFVPLVPGRGSTNPTRAIFQASENGERFAYAGEAGETGGGGQIGQGAVGNEWLTTRGTQGWQTELITPRKVLSPTEETFPALFQGFSSDLAIGYLDTITEPNTEYVNGSPICQVLYQRTTPSGNFQPLANVSQSETGCGHPLFAGASTDGQTTLIQTEAALTTNAVEATELPAENNSHTSLEGLQTSPCEFGCNLYAAAGESLELVNVLPGAEERTVPNATFGGYAGNNSPDFSNAIADNGARIFWTDTQGAPRVFVRENRNATVQVSGEGPAQYWTATPDGEYALYTENGVLWAFDTATGTRQELAGEGVHHEPADVEGVIGTNTSGEDLSYVYFVASTVLATNDGAKSQPATPGAPNLYVFHNGVTSFVATLSAIDNQLIATPNPTAQFGDWVADVGNRTAEVTPDGRHIGFEAIEALTGYENDDAARQREAIPETFVFDAESGILSCASCAPSGHAPTVGNPEQVERASQVPVSTPSYVTMRRWLSTDGSRVFFDTPQALSSQGDPGKWNVYEWEATGEGTCTQTESSEVTGGCTYLISGSGSEDDSFFIDADASGANVFFNHRGSLGSASVSSGRDELYDARINGGFVETTTGCIGASCPSADQGALESFSIPSTTYEVVSDNYSKVSESVAKAPPAKKKSTPRERALKACHRYKRAKRRKTCESRVDARYKTAVKSQHAKGHKS